MYGQEPSTVRVVKETIVSAIARAFHPVSKKFNAFETIRAAGSVSAPDIFHEIAAGQIVPTAMAVITSRFAHRMIEQLDLQSFTPAQHTVGTIGSSHAEWTVVHHLNTALTLDDNHLNQPLDQTTDIQDHHRALEG
ncbi:hypothetical protein GCK32_019109 [Trichostrongylus colubriformis]|uniref:Uncharacterized protein n=1 Tax=Trichostrongylus colubriformis TaxID=6319 RepID=A0AAN8G895_TRICO